MVRSALGASHIGRVVEHGFHNAYVHFQRAVTGIQSVQGLLGDKVDTSNPFLDEPFSNCPVCSAVAVEDKPGERYVLMLRHHHCATIMMASWQLWLTEQVLTRAPPVQRCRQSHAWVLALLAQMSHTRSA